MSGGAGLIDYDRDGNLDVFIGEMGDPGAGDNAKTFIWYGNGQGDFKETLLSHGQGIHEGKLADLDGDGDPDVLMKPYHHRTPRLDVFGEAEYDTHEQWEGRVGLSYTLGKDFSLVGHWHSDHGWGGGLQVRF